MNNEIEDIRKSIAQRKRNRLNLSPKPKGKKINMTSMVPDHEEKHGFFPSFPDVSKKDRGSKNSMISVNGLLIKACLSACIFLGAMILFQSNQGFLEKPKLWASAAFSKEFPFASVHHWYKETLGSPLAFSPTDDRNDREVEAVALPVSGNIAEEFQINGSGIKIAPDSATEVTAWDSGIIIFAGNDHKTDKTVVIQHANGSQSTYALLSSVDVHLYQSITAGERIGTFNPETENESIYFSLEKDNEYIDPVKVIQVDVDEAP